MNRFWYSVLLYVLAPLIWVWMALRARKAGGEWGILSAQRFGRYSGSGILQTFPSRAPIWIHAVSMGETRAAQPLIRALLDRRLPILLTNTTATGRAEAGKLFAPEIAAGELVQVWLPYDFPGAVNRFMRHFMPRCGILIEREVWPNLLHAAVVEHVAMLLVSARMSENSLKRSGRFRKLWQEAYSSLELALAQTEDDAARLRILGVRDLVVGGNLKFDVALDVPRVQTGRQWRAAVGRPIVVVASTRDGEERAFLNAIDMQWDAGAAQAIAQDRPLYVLVPRHPQRFSEVIAEVRRHRRNLITRSSGVVPDDSTEIVVGDTMGEMAFYYGAADLAIIGGGYANLGGQNLIEACAAGVPVIVGPHMYNFAQATRDAISAGAAIQVSDAAEALNVAVELVRDGTRRRAMQQACLAWTQGHVGATGRVLEALRPWLGISLEEVGTP